MTSVRKILYVINGAAFFNTRLSNLARAAEDSGFEVHVATPNSPEARRIPEMGFAFHPVSISRSRIRPWPEIKTYLGLAALYDRLKPDLVHHFTIKPVIYGGLAARRTRVPATVSTMTGLGFVFSSKRLKARLLRPVLQPFLRSAMKMRNIKVVFQNPEDRNIFLDHGLIKTGRTALINGTGVDISEFRQTLEPEGRPMVLFASRMLIEKGAAEFVEMAGNLRKAGVEARFVMVGDSDPGYPSSISRDQLRTWEQSGRIEWWGPKTDMPSVLAEASLVCLPSHYGEGVPRILVEAAACARASVTFDTPGCREIVRHGENGLLAPAGDLPGFSAAVKSLLSDRRTRTAMGFRGRKLVEEKFTQKIIIAQNLAIYEELQQCS